MRHTCHAIRCDQPCPEDTLYRSGVAPEVAASLLGHSPTTALAKYRQVSRADMLTAVEAVGLGVVPGGRVIEMKKWEEV